MFVIYEFEVREGEFFLNHFGQFGLYWLCPLAYEDYKFVDIPSNSPTWHSIVCSLFNLFGRDFLWVLYRFAAASHIGLAGIAR